MDKMNAIIFRKTGHLLGAVTRSTQPNTPAKTQDVAAGGIRIRDSGDNATHENIIVQVPEDEVSVSLVDYNTRVLFRPQNYGLSRGELLALDDHNLPTVAVSGTDLDLTLPGNSEDKTVWCLIFGDSLREPVIAAVELQDDPSSVANEADAGTAEVQPLPNGDYRVAVFAPGYAVRVLPFAVS